MHRLLTFGTVILLVTGAAGCSDREDTAHRPGLDAAVGIRASGCRTAPSLGGGAVVGDGLVVTVAHVVAGADAIDVVDRLGDSHAAHPVFIDTVDDIAILSAPDLSADPLEIGSFPDGQTGFYVTFDGDGAPTAEPFEIIRRVDISISDIYDEGDHRRPGYEIRADVDPGNSGAVLVSPSGIAGGLVFASSRREEPRAWATNLALLAPILDSIGAQPAPAVPCSP